MRIFFAIMACVLAGAVFGAVDGDVRLSQPPDADAPDERLYMAAARSFQGGHWATAARWFRELMERHANSPRRPEAVLRLAQSLYMQGELENKQARSKQAQALFADAIQELAKNSLADGPWAAESLFWEAECRSSQTNLVVAAQKYQELLRQHPKSSRAAESMVALAHLSARQRNWVQVVEQLQPAEGVFQKHAAQLPNGETSLAGGLLLAQALFEQGDLPSAGAALEKLPRQLLGGQDWRRRLLRARIAKADGNLAKAELLGDQLRAQAEQQNSIEWLVSACQFRAQLFAGQAKWIEAEREWAHLMKENLPVDVRQLAALNVARARIHGRDLAGAVIALNKLQAQTDFKAVHPVAGCVLGELHLALHRSGHPGQLNLAALHFGRLIGDEKNKSLHAQAWWGLAQCQLEQLESAQAREALYKARATVVDAGLRARIQYQLALGLSRDGAHAEAAAGFQNVRTNALEGISAELLNAARFMQFRNNLAENSTANAEVLLAEMRAQASASHLDKALLTLARMRIDRQEREPARAVLVEFQQQTPGSTLRPAADLEAIWLLVLEGKWAEVNAGYKKWLQKYSKHPDRPRVLFDQAWALAQAGELKQAETKFSQLSTNRPAASPVFMARMWLADRAYNSQTNRLAAEKLYKEIRGATNCPPTLRHRAGMMAGRAAMERQGYREARAVFAGLIDDGQVKANSPSIHIEASFALGDLTMLELGSGVQNQIEKLTQSTNAFYRLIEMNKTNAVAARAWGRIGDCCLMVSGDQPDYHPHAKAAYKKSLELEDGPVPVNVRCQAYVGLAQALERQPAAGEDRVKLLKEAAAHLGAVYSGPRLKKGEKLDRYWRRQSGILLLGLLEELGDFEHALRICSELKKDFSGMRAGLDIRMKQIEKLKAAQP